MITVWQRVEYYTNAAWYEHVVITTNGYKQVEITADNLQNTEENEIHSSWMTFNPSVPVSAWLERPLWLWLAFLFIEFMILLAVDLRLNTLICLGLNIACPFFLPSEIVSEAVKQK